MSLQNIKDFKPDSHLVEEIILSPNYGDRKGVKQPDIIILHYTGMPDTQKAINWLSSPQSEVSCHYVIKEDGTLIQMVPENKRAWHAGESCWQNKTDINSHSIGIEIANSGHDFGSPDFTPQQIEKTIKLCHDLVKRYKIKPHKILAHSDVAPQRKKDPGEKFPWKELASQGIGHWVEPRPLTKDLFWSRGNSGPPIEGLQSLLNMYGYKTEINGIYDVTLENIIFAFQRHFRPRRIDGIADMSTITTLRDLLKSIP